MKKSELNENIRISESNVKLNHVKNKGVVFLMFSLPSIKSCPFATDKCKSSCFGNRGVFALPNNRRCYERNFEETKKDTFVKDMIDHISYQISRKKMSDKVIYFRIHQTGDFHSKEYLKKWVEIAEYFKGNDKIKFQAYTKSVDFIENLNSNLQLIYSRMSDTKEEQIQKASMLGMNIYNTVEMKIDDFEEYKLNNGANHYCKGECENCLSCYEGLNLVTINRLRKNGEPSMYKNKNINEFWTTEKKSQWNKDNKRCKNDNQRYNDSCRSNGVVEVG